MTDLTRVYRPSVPEGFEWVVPTDSRDFEVLRALGERRPGDSWRPIRVTMVRVDDQGRAQARAEMPWLGSHALVLRDKAIESVGPILKRCGELLPLLCEEARVVLFSAPLVSGALNEDLSEMVRFGSGRIMALPAPSSE